MCFSAAASFTSAAVLVPAGALTIQRAWKTDRRYLAIGALPLLFGLQQFSEGMVWLGGSYQAPALVAKFSLAYMFFAWFLWPVWVPFATFFTEPARRKPLYLLFAIAGATLGGLQYVPYFAHDDWLVTTFLSRAIAYGGTELLDSVIGRTTTYTIYLVIIVAPLLIATDRRLRVFGVLVGLVFVTTYLFFRYAYISVFCFGGALMSLYLVYVIFRLDRRKPVGALAAA